MITVHVWPGIPHIKIEGHALSAEPGKDLVCCAASTIAYTLANYLDKTIGSDRMECDGAEGGSAFMEIKAHPGMGSVVECLSAFNMAICGLEMLTETFPENVQIIRESEDDE